MQKKRCPNTLQDGVREVEV